ncbi:penicillin acylase family protein [Photobacterium minamisatsumaniensis]|uniref:penicillin acylase family protein n=1 Tax=Photobacterium minamisatsumaniensis TaxID=2910233 RepID=UPI003D11DF57
MFNKSLVAISTIIGLSLVSGCSSFSTSQEITIKRDDYGTPHIYADTTYGLFYGYGYAIAQDRLFQLEMAKRSAQGNVSAVLGKEFLPLDIKVREHYNPHTIKAAMTSLSKEDLDIFKGYAEGINQWITKINQSSDLLMPKQFIDNQFTPTTWDEFDVVMVFVGSMINRFGDYNTELDNQQLLTALSSQHGSQLGNDIFDSILPHMSDQAVDTIPAGEWSSADRKNIKAELVAKLDQQDVEPTKLLAANLQLESSGRQGTLNWRGFNEAPFSNILVLGKDKTDGANAVLINGPQFGFYRPAYTYSVGLHGAGYDAVGNSPAGYPLIQFGHNGQISWGSTWGAGDNVDLFQLTLNPNNPEEYLYQGKYIPFEQENQTINVKNSSNKVITVYRSVHGPVIKYEPEQNIAYAKKRGWAGKELSTLMAWNKVSKAQNHQQWSDYVADSAINVNWYYADQDGNIAYALGGHYPVRHPDFDGRLPTPGDGSGDWLGLYPFSTNPQVLNPSSGYIANWNNRPAADFPNPDQWWYSWNTVDRNIELTSRIEAKNTLSSQEAWDLMVEASVIDPNARHFVPSLVSLAQSSNEPAHQKAAQILNDWDFSNTDNNQNGKYDHPASALFRTWLQEVLEITYSPIIPKSNLAWFTNPGYGNKDKVLANSYNIQTSTKALANIMNNPQLFKASDSQDIQLQALTSAVASLTQQYGANSDNWLEQVDVLRFNNKNYIGVPQAGEDEVSDTPIALNRGTENNMTVFKQDSIEAFEIAAPGQSGFIAPDGSPSKHYDDQYDDFINFRLKPVYFERDVLKAKYASKTVLTIQ